MRMMLLSLKGAELYTEVLSLARLLHSSILDFVSNCENNEWVDGWWPFEEDTIGLNRRFIVSGAPLCYRIAISDDE